MSILWYQQLLRTIASNQDLLLYISMWNAVNEVLQVKGLLATGKNRYIHEEQKATTKRGTSQPMALDAIMLWLLGDAIVMQYDPQLTQVW